jgi:hypothetical protein
MVHLVIFGIRVISSSYNNIPELLLCCDDLITKYEIIFIVGWNKKKHSAE